MTTRDQRWDVAVVGGGMAGLTVALQLKTRLPDASIVVLEPTRRPLPEACHKVGESSVEVGAHYLGAVLGLRPYLLESHLKKNGLRFFGGPATSPLERRSEMGPREPPKAPAYQIDRGRFENDLRQRCVDAGVSLLEGCGARAVELSSDEDGAHRVTFVELGADREVQTLEARWVLDASGRRRLLAKQLGLARPVEVQAGAAWFRIDERIDIAELVPAAQSSWHERDVDGERWLSTNHLTGDGRWVWIIPLSSGHTSIGLVAEASHHDFPDYGTPDALRAWLAEHEPLLAARIEGKEWADFIAMRDYRHQTSRVLSPDRWALLGEAALFVDPLYSPGADVIGLLNCAATELIVEDLEGGGLNTARVEALDTFVRDWARLLERTLHDGTAVFGRPEVLGAKLYWDYFYYWAMLCPYFIQGIYAVPVEEHEAFGEMLGRWDALNAKAQSVLQAWAPHASREPVADFVGLPQPATQLSDLHLELLVEKTPAQTLADMETALGWGEALVAELLLRALRTAGPDGAERVAREAGLERWRPRIDERRFAADEGPARKRRKLLETAVRDFERSVGRSARAEGAASLRELYGAAVSGLGSAER